MASPTIRSARQADLDELAEIERAAFPDPWPRQGIAEELEAASALVLVGSLPGQMQLSGWICFRLLPGEAELLRVGVIPVARREGLGRALVAAGLDRLGELGLSRCFLEVRRGNLPARALYEAFGFGAVGLRRAYYADGEDAFVYARPAPGR